MNKRLVALFLPLAMAMLGATVFVPSAKAQSHATFASGPSRGFVHVRRAGRFFAGPGFGPYFYSDYDSEPLIIEAPPPQIVETAQPASPAPVRNPPESLMLELQGDHWVRITNNGQSQIGGQSGQPELERASNPSSAMPRRTQAPEPASDLPPVVLVFRDGHKEEIGKYAIVGATIYTSADYWSSGSWTRKVQIAELDVPETLKLNQERGAKFSLPSGPNEVIIRP
ncbi:MAG: hypothetical protein ABSE45_04145 [Candidatus Acidiferrales bacterium]|jgi:hypothetical protein